MLLFLYNRASAQCRLITGSTSNFAIVIPDASYSNAATLFQNVVNKATGFKMNIKQGNVSCTNCVAIGTQTDFKEDPVINKASLNSDGIIMDIKKSRISLVSKSADRLEYPVVEFLKKYLNANVFDTTGVKVNRVANLTVANTTTVYNPPFLSRDLYYKNGFDESFMDWNEINHIWATKDSKWGNFVHTAYQFIDVPKYFKSNPEYFALVNQKRSTTQLCYSNDDVYQIVLKNLRDKIRNAPDKKIWSFSQLDNNNVCQCDKCQATEKRLGTRGGPLFEFVNRLAKDNPDVSISTLAYGFSAPPPSPDKFKLASNVVIVFCVTQGNKGRDIATDASFGDMRKWLTGWLGQTRKIIIWDYIVNFSHLLMPYPNFQSIAQSLQYYKSLGIKEIFLQGNIQKGGEFADLRCYVASQLLWNPDADVNKLIKQYADYAYGPASADVQQLLGNLINNGRQTDINHYYAPDRLSTSLFSPDKMDNYYGNLDNSLKKVPKNSRYYDNLMQIRLDFDYTNVEIQRTNKKQRDPQKLNKAILELQKYSNTNTSVNENNKTLKDYINDSKKADKN